MLGSSFISRRNQMAVKREAVNAAWAQVDVVLQRRADLIPNLVETVKGLCGAGANRVRRYRQRRVPRCLARILPAEKIAANGQLDSALGRLLVVVENYPQLRSNENFLRLQDELAGTENRSRWSAAVTTRRCRITTRLLRSSRTVWCEHEWIYSERCLLQDGRRRAAGPKVSFGTRTHRLRDPSQRLQALEFCSSKRRFLR